MFFRILKKDLKRKKGVHIILLLFIIIATIFLGSSVNNIFVVMNATDYSMDQANIPDYYVSTMVEEGTLSEGKSIEQWLNEESEYADSFDSSDGIVIMGKENLFIEKSGKESEYDITQTIMLESESEKYMKILDDKGNPAEIEEGEIGIPYTEMERNHLEIGDYIKVQTGNYEKSLRIKMVIKDIAFGSEFIGMKRLLISKEDFAYLNKSQESIKYKNYYIDTENLEKFKKELNRNQFDVNISAERDLFKTAYIMNMLVASILILVGGCLILIAFLVLRFTIVFTIQEDFREIGIMKAIGIKSFGIKRLYLIKYFVIVLIGAVIGCLLSFPVSDILADRVSMNILVQSSVGNWVLNVICSCIIIITVLFLCYLSTAKLDKYSAISTIRNGNTGERFKKISKMRLLRHKKMAVPLFLGWNDICSNIKKYIVLLITFCIGTILIILPLNVINTMNSTEMAIQFGVNRETDFCTREIETGKQISTFADLSDAIDRMSDKFQDKKIDVDLYGSVYYTFSYYADNEKDSFSVFTIQPVNEGGAYKEYIEGKEPELDNEIAMSQKMMEEMKVTVGDTIYSTIEGKKREFIISGQYQDFMQLGKSARLNGEISCGNTPIPGYAYIEGKLNSENVTVEKLKKVFPEFKIISVMEAVDDQMGGARSIVNQLKNFMVLLISCINILITVLMVKIFIEGERGEFAMAKSMGFRVKTLRLWLIVRVVSVLMAAVVLGILLSTGLNNIVIRPIFGIMGGTHIRIVVLPVEVYFLYPLVLFVGTTLATIISSGGIKKIDLREMKDLE